MKKSITNELRKSVVLPQVDILCNPAAIQDVMCEEHHLIKDQIVFQDFDRYKVGHSFCAICAGSLQEQFEVNGKSFFVKPSHVLINRNCNKILEIKGVDLRQINRNMSAMSSDCKNSLNILNEKIEPISEQLENFTSYIKDGIFSRLSGCSDTIEKLRQTKEFIDTMTLTEKGEPVLESIGGKEDLKIKYANLAKFLIQWHGVGEIKGDFSDIVKYFKYTIDQLNEIRFSSVNNMDLLMKSLLGPMYDFIFELEKLPVDEEFRAKYLTEYRNETYTKNLITAHQKEIQEKDRRIKELELSLNNQISSNEQLVSLNNQYKLQVDELNGRLIAMRIEFEKKIKLALDTLKSEYDKKYNEVKRISSEWEKKCKELEQEKEDIILLSTNELKTKTEKFNCEIATLKDRVKFLEEQNHDILDERDSKNKVIDELEEKLFKNLDLLRKTQDLFNENDAQFRNMVLERDSQIILFTQKIQFMLVDWKKLNEAYTLLETELRTQIQSNDELREVVKYLKENNDGHNDYIRKYESEMKLVFEQFVRSALKKKTIDYNDPSEKVNTHEKNSSNSKEILEKFTRMRPNESSSFISVENVLKDVKTELTKFTDVELPF